MRNLLIAALSMSLMSACGGQLPRDFETGQVQAVVEGFGDKLHPHLDGNWLVWFDLETDPNGACHVPSYGGSEEYDNTCEGVIKSKNLFSGEVHTLSDLLYEETLPVVSGTQVAWRCRTDAGYGLCVSKVNRKDRTFLSGVGWTNYWYERGKRPGVADGSAVWAQYEYYHYRSVYRLKQANLSNGQIDDIVRLDQYPSEVTFFDGLAAWNESRWENGYQYLLQMIDINSGARTIVVEDEQPVYGLGGWGDLLAWKRGTPDYGGEEDDPEAGVHVYVRQTGGLVERIDSPEAKVSAETPIAVGDNLVVWLDHREGLYRVAAYDLNGGGEALVSPAEAMISAYFTPAVSADFIVWPDRINGDFDLYLFKF